MKCDRIKIHLSSLADNELNKDEACRLKEHLEQCVECQKDLKEFIEFRDVFVRIPEIEVPYYFRTRLMQAIHDHQAVSRSLAGRFKKALLPAAAAAAVIISLVFGNYIGENLYQMFAGRSQSENGTFEILDFALNSFPEGSLSEVYQNVLAEGKNE